MNAQSVIVDKTSPLQLDIRLTVIIIRTPHNCHTLRLSGLAFYLGANNMWSTNTAPDFGLCDATEAAANPLHSGSTYTLISVGRVTITPVPASGGGGANPLMNANFTAAMDMAHGLLNTTLTASSPTSRRSGSDIDKPNERDNESDDSVAPALFAQTIAVSDRDAVLVRLEAMATAVDVVVEVSVPQSGTSTSAHPPFVLPTESGVSPSGTYVYAARQGVNQTDNNVVLNTCGRGGQHRDAQRFSVDASGAVTLADGRCLVLDDPPRGRDCNATTRRITIGSCNSQSGQHNNSNRGRVTAWQFSDGQLSARGDDGVVYFAAVTSPRPPPPPPPPPPVPGYTWVAGDVGGQSKGGQPLCNCTTVAACPAEAAKQCDAWSDCRSFAVYSHGGHPGWNGWCQMYDAKDTAGRYADTGWDLWLRSASHDEGVDVDGRGGGRISSAKSADGDGSKAKSRTHHTGSHDGASSGDFMPTVYFVAASTTPASTLWQFNETTGYLMGGDVGSALDGDGCLTLVEPNRNLNSAVAVSVSSDASGAQPLSSPWTDGAWDLSLLYPLFFVALFRLFSRIRCVVSCYSIFSLILIESLNLCHVDATTQERDPPTSAFIWSRVHPCGSLLASRCAATGVKPSAHPRALCRPHQTPTAR